MGIELLQNTSDDPSSELESSAILDSLNWY